MSQGGRVLPAFCEKEDQVLKSRLRKVRGDRGSKRRKDRKAVLTGHSVGFRGDDAKGKKERKTE
jgi:hypothetical protein